MNNRKIKQAKSVEQVYLSAYWHLERKDLSQFQLRTALERKTEKTEWVDEVLSHCLELGYVKSDDAFTANFIERSVNGRFRGRSWIERELSKAGIDKALTSEKFEELDIDFVGVINEHLLEKYSENGCNIEERKLKNKLIGRGFSYNDISKAIQLSELNFVNVTTAPTKVSKSKAVDEVKTFEKYYRQGKGLRFIETRIKELGGDCNRFKHMINDINYDFFKLAEITLSKKNFNLHDYKERSKAWAYLTSRGFDSEQIKEAISALST